MGRHVPAGFLGFYTLWVGDTALRTEAGALSRESSENPVVDSGFFIWRLGEEKKVQELDFAFENLLTLLLKQVSRQR